MSLSVAAKAAIFLARNKKMRTLLCMILVFLFFIFMLPFFLLFCILAMLHPDTEALDQDLYYQQVQALRQEYTIENDLPVYLIKAMELTMHGDLRFTEQQIRVFIEQHFIEENVVELLVETEKEIIVEGETQRVIETRTEVTTLYFFYSFAQMMDRAKKAPFYFTDEEIQMIEFLYLATPDSEASGSGKYPLPVSDRISSGYGNRIDPLNGKYFMHPALDIVPSHHAPIISIADGVVVRVDTTLGNTYGNNVTIAHKQNGDTFYTFSAHLSKVFVSVGQQLVMGEMIGLEGGDPKTDPNPGRTTGHHLHFEIWRENNRKTHIDPANYIQLGDIR